MPSALILFAFAMSAAAFTGPIAEGFLHGLQLVAIAIVVFFVGSFGQIAAIALGACAGLWLCEGEATPVSGHPDFPVTRLGGGIALALFAALLLVAPAIATATGSQGLALFNAFYRSGALCGGHVVLPLLQAQVVTPGWVTNEAFLAGYGLAQAVPGPLFTFAAYLGALMVPAAERHSRCSHYPRRAAASGHAARLWHVAILGCVAHKLLQPRDIFDLTLVLGVDSFERETSLWSFSSRTTLAP
jgi:chromate transporter